MHLKNGVPKRILAMMMLFFTLTACSGGPSAEKRMLEVRDVYKDLTSLTAEAEITADYGERVYDYTVRVEGNAENGSMTVLTPENIAGTVLRWSDGETLLDYDGISLETGPLTAGGLSPADAIPAILETISVGTLTECSLSKENILSAELQSPADPAVTVTCRFDGETGAIREAEMAENGVRVLTIAFMEFQSA